MNGRKNIHKAILDVRNLTFQYGQKKHPVLRQIRFSLEENGALLLLGPSGSGKSTLTFCLNGLYPEAVNGCLEGEILVMGKNVQEYPPGYLARHVGIVFQDPESQFCMMRVEDEVAFGLENIQTPSDQIDGKIKEALDLVGLLPYRKAAIHQLSAGMKQKLALACALAMNPKILILDEPTANLDPASAREFVHLLKKIRKEQGLTLLVIEHKLEEWLEFVHKAIVLNGEGSIVYDGNVRDLFARYDQTLEASGIWVPSVVKLGRELKRKRFYQGEAVPLTVEELLSGIADAERSKQAVGTFLQNKRKRNAVQKHPPFLEIRNLSAKIQEKTVLKNVSLSVHPGEIIALAGPNGAGKTTLTLHLAGLLPAQEGEIVLKGKNLADWKERELRKEVGYVFQNPEHQFVTDTVFDEVAYGLRLQGWMEREMERKVKEILHHLNLTSLEHCHPFSLSQGQKRRLSVATMLVDEQKLLILDEPTFGQDARTAEELMGILQEKAASGHAILMVTHDMDLVWRYAHRIIVLVDGELRFDGPPEDLWERVPALAEDAKLLPPADWSVYLALNQKKERKAGGCLI